MKCIEAWLDHSMINLTERKMLKALFFGSTTLLGIAMVTNAYAAESPITGTVESKCSIYTTTEGVYGNPSPNTLSTTASDGGVEAIIRIDVASANYYIGRITHPDAFSSSPSLVDGVTWAGDVTVNQVSDPLMSDYDTNKVTYNNVHEYDLAVAGSTWFKVSSTATYGVDKSFPAGTYTAIATAECIAK